MGSVLKLFYDKWITKENNKFPLPNILPNELVEFSKNHVMSEPQGVRILENRAFLENELSRENDKEILRFFHCNFFSYFVKHHGMENVVEDVIDDDATYLYPIELKNYDMLWIPQSYTLGGQEYTYTVAQTLSHKVIELLKAKKLKIVASIPFEPVNEISGILKFREELKKFGIDNDDSIVVVGGNTFENSDNLKVFGVNLPLTQKAEELYQFIQSKIPYYGGLPYESEYILPEDLNNTIVRKYKFLSFNRSMNRFHRVVLAHTVLEHNLLNEGIFSFIGGDLLTMSDDVSRDITSKLVRYYNNINNLEYYVERIKSLIPYEIDTQHLSLEQKCGFATNNNKKDFYLDTYIHLTSESRFSTGKHRGVFFSEKTYRPIINLQPFVMLGDPGTLDELHKLGFKTFHPFIDESYDQEVSEVERFKLIQKEILKLNQKTIEEIHNWYYSITDILLHNQTLLQKYHTTNPFQEITKQSWL